MKILVAVFIIQVANFAWAISADMNPLVQAFALLGVIVVGGCIIKCADY